jgi:putative ABC transport system ATP-binding protein
MSASSSRVDVREERARRELIKADSIRRSFGEGDLEVEVLHGVDLTIRAGELVLLMGPSGSGKTTLLSILAGLLRPTSGRVELCGVDITAAGDAAASRVRRDSVGFVFQGYNLFPALSALDNVAEVLCMRGKSRREARELAAIALDRVGLSARSSHRPGELSGGQKQRVAIARAIAGAPSLLIGDEPTAALDSVTGISVMSLLRAQVDAERSVLIVTHDTRLLGFADRVIEIEDGRVVSTFEPRDARPPAHPEHAPAHSQKQESKP